MTIGDAYDHFPIFMLAGNQHRIRYSKHKQDVIVLDKPVYMTLDRNLTEESFFHKFYRTSQMMFFYHNSLVRIKNISLAKHVRPRKNKDMLHKLGPVSEY